MQGWVSSWKCKGRKSWQCETLRRTRTQTLSISCLPQLTVQRGTHEGPGEVSAQDRAMQRASCESTLLFRVHSPPTCISCGKNLKLDGQKDRAQRGQSSWRMGEYHPSKEVTERMSPISAQILGRPSNVAGRRQTYGSRPGKPQWAATEWLSITAYHRGLKVYSWNPGKLLTRTTSEEHDSIQSLQHFTYNIRFSAKNY